ncbi:MAG: hypothetical protein ACLR2G_02220 [Phascolarctobacterium faecium]
MYRSAVLPAHRLLVPLLEKVAPLSTVLGPETISTLLRIYAGMLRVWLNILGIPLM